MDQNGLQPRDLIPFIGSRNRVHEVLNRRRSLTLKMIWRLKERLGIPAESLIKGGRSGQPEANRLAIRAGAGTREKFQGSMNFASKTASAKQARRPAPIIAM